MMTQERDKNISSYMKRKWRQILIFVFRPFLFLNIIMVLLEFVNKKNFSQAHFGKFSTSATYEYLWNCAENTELKLIPQYSHETEAQTKKSESFKTTETVTAQTLDFYSGDIEKIWTWKNPYWDWNVKFLCFLWAHFLLSLKIKTLQKAHRSV